MLKKIISGGQTGADQGGLEIGKELGLKTGGTAPWNWMTASGPRQTLLESYGLVVGPYDPWTYPQRTLMNVLDGDGTALFGNLDSPGCRLTIKYCKLYGKVYIENPSPRELADWIKNMDIVVLNVAGNREHTNPGIKTATKNVISLAYRLLTEFTDA